MVNLNVNAGDNFRVITLPAGDYTWRGIYAGDRYKEFDDIYDFTITPGTINYIGDVYVDIASDSKRFRLTFAKDNRKTWERFKEA